MREAGEVFILPAAPLPRLLATAVRSGSAVRHAVGGDGSERLWELVVMQEHADGSEIPGSVVDFTVFSNVDAASHGICAG